MGLLLKTLLHIATSGQKLHRAPLNHYITEIKLEIEVGIELPCYSAANLLFYRTHKLEYFTSILSAKKCKLYFCSVISEIKVT